ncbi:flavin reductase family protein [Sneathiella chinensis]|uniref:Flavin reductase like domain-containing protein n=1 Tax=Sneathiella chinensis TaxID=349750 RepID=A0ABQ5U6L1_9PROT|nr:flavin reductase family protein [Sneathiella chinensis]GLQ06858.1 hypothetical protein GCM10007924_20790 [Sneathiella chinensis]
MHFDFSDLDSVQAYKLLGSTVTPRPIAWITTLSRDKVVNAAPYSFFNVMGHTPPTVAVGILKDPVKGFKDTSANIMEQGEFVINLVPEALAEAMNITAIDAPKEVGELDLAGLTTLPSAKVAPPQIAQSPVSIECVNLSSVVTGPEQVIVIGRVVSMRIDDRYVENAERCYVDTAGLDLVGRLHGTGWYSRTRDRFQIERPKYADWKNKEEKQTS